MNFENATLPLKHAGIEFFGNPPILLPYLFNPRVEFEDMSSVFYATVGEADWSIFLSRPISDSVMYGAIDDLCFFTADGWKLVQDMDRIAVSIFKCKVHRSEKAINIYQFMETQRDPSKRDSIKYVVSEV